MSVLMACSVYPNLIEAFSYVLHKSIPKLKSIYSKIIYFALMKTEENRKIWRKMIVKKRNRKKKNRKSRGFI